MVTLTVAGTAQHFHPAERGTVRLEIRRESRSRSAVLAEVVSLHATVRDQARSEQQSGAATWWSADQVSVSTVRRFLKDSDVAEVFHVAAASARVKYRDFDALGRWVSSVSELPGVVISGVEWALTADHRAALEREVRVAAVKDAQERASAYASALGLSEVRVLTLFEPGLRPNTANSGGGHGAMSRMAAFSSQEEPLALKPEDIEVSASISADFEAL
ncbi:SIMPL domain-containing protein [Rathayibacter sp. SD072]|uniref:SIMPL domain-containing protein n=1 Tax=Rathayibacter sp. SD072 TaxID=2781731 RepID=UPI001A96F853|nr:SIMPL domain-containing protein [Rathayibacter sp. SD072]MBO0982464.1 SIMPL domain-containing protein [Rathayibacter sp. SD072]